MNFVIISKKADQYQKKNQIKRVHVFQCLSPKKIWELIASGFESDILRSLHIKKIVFNTNPSVGVFVRSSHGTLIRGFDVTL